VCFVQPTKIVSRWTLLSAGLLAASLEKLSAREKELLDNKSFVESKRAERVKEVSQLEESLKAERKHFKRLKRTAAAAETFADAGASGATADKDVVESKARVAELQAAVQVTESPSPNLASP
jgi:alanyl-tRNA synthetase